MSTSCSNFTPWCFSGNCYEVFSKCHFLHPLIFFIRCLFVAGKNLLQSKAKSMLQLVHFHPQGRLQNRENMVSCHLANFGMTTPFWIPCHLLSAKIFHSSVSFPRRTPATKSMVRGKPLQFAAIFCPMLTSSVGQLWLPNNGKS